MKNLKGKVALITGGASGIGKKMALLLAKEGCKIIILDTDKKKLDNVVKELCTMNCQVEGYKCDVANKNAVNALSKKISKKNKVDILINNAGVVTGKKFLECSDDELIKTMNVNIISHFWTVRAFLPAMIKNNQGHIVTIASSAGLIGVDGLVDYCTSKWAAVGFTESIKNELSRIKNNKIKTTCVCPFFINTGMFKGVKTRFNFLLPLLDEDKTASKIVKAIKKDKVILKMPFMVKAITLLRLFPTVIFDLVVNLFGINSSMDTFIGRKKNKA